MDNGVDILGGSGGFLGELLHLRRHDGKASAGLSCPSRFDIGIQRQQIRLTGDLRDQPRCLLNLLRRLIGLIRLLIDPLNGDRRALVCLHQLRQRPESLFAGLAHPVCRLRQYGDLGSRVQDHFPDHRHIFIDAHRLIRSGRDLTDRRLHLGYIFIGVARIPAELI